MRFPGAPLGVGVILGLLCDLWIAQHCGALDPGKWKERQINSQQFPMEIRAGRMELRRQDNLILYTENVVVQQLDYRMESRELEVRWDPKTRKIKQLVARGSVRVQTEDAQATCGLALLDVAGQSLEMRESPRMVQEGEHVEGERILYFFTERKSTVLGGKTGRVRTRVVPGGKP